jgi:glycosyltransferase involved in cell wall biosynthesis
MALLTAQESTGVVVIGRNEGARLGRSLEALAGRAAEVVYVDSNSTDGSRDLAARLGATVVHLTEGPFTPSRGRQVGFEALVARRPDLEYVQFIDGDCVVHPDWLAKAAAYLDAHPDVAAVFGRRREERCAESFYSRLMDLDWDHPPGEAANFGGDALVRAGAVQAAGGWSAETINAEDIDLSFRIRAQGGRIVRLGEEMTLHDVRMTRFSEYWRRAVRAGYGYAEVGLRYARGPGRALLRRLASSVIYVAVLPALGVLGAVCFWPLLVLVLVLYARVIAVMARGCLHKGGAIGTSLAYAVLNLACKAGSLLGSLQYFADRISGRKTPRADLVIYRRQSSG